MTKADPSRFHKLYGVKKPKVTYFERDFLDYVLMISLSALVVIFSYGFGRVMGVIGFALCVFMIAMFIRRHGIDFRVPMILRRPQEVLYMFIYKLENLPLVYFIALGLLLLENALIAATPNFPHHVESMRMIAFYLFYVHFICITVYRTVILIAHLAKKELVREILIQTAWKRAVNEKTNITLEIVHAYCTGLLTHIVLIAPWYLVITYCSFSAPFLPVVCLINIVVELKWLKAHNVWFYRDHWLGHNSEFEFIYLHGPHHDAIPCGLIGAAEHGFLEGFMRSTMAFPGPFYNPIIAFISYTLLIKRNIDVHQYIPGIFPRLPRKFMEIAQHSTHHYGTLEPYSLGMKLDQPGISEDLKKAFDWIPEEVKNSVKLDEEMTGFKWDNPTYRKTLSLYSKYDK
jgi:hypothetical protein